MTQSQKAPAEEIDPNPFSARRMPTWTLALLGAKVIKLETVHRRIEANLNAQAAEVRKRFPQGDPAGVFGGLKVP
jgi:hypothetical protein